jgi:hypothetical protein
VAEIRRREESFISRAIESWSANPNVLILGNPKAERLSIVSFVVRYGDRYLHHNFVVALLNDLFGIQARGGCSCAGPYGHRLLGIDVDTSNRLETEIGKGCEVIKPGWVRVNFNYFISEEEFRYIIDAVHLVAEAGWRLLPHYRFESDTALWRHRLGLPRPPMSLHELDYSDGTLGHQTERLTAADDPYDEYMAEAHRLVTVAASISEDVDEMLDDDAEQLRWFPLPHEVAV